MIPGNKNFEKHIEYTGAVKHFFGKKWYAVVTLHSINILVQVHSFSNLPQFVLAVLQHSEHHHMFTVTRPIPCVYIWQDLCIANTTTSISWTYS